MNAPASQRPRLLRAKSSANCGSCENTAPPNLNMNVQAGDRASCKLPLGGGGGNILQPQGSVSYAPPATQAIKGGRPGLASSGGLGGFGSWAPGIQAQACQPRAPLTSVLGEITNHGQPGGLRAPLACSLSCQPQPRQGAPPPAAAAVRPAGDQAGPPSPTSTHEGEHPMHVDSDEPPQLSCEDNAEEAGEYLPDIFARLRGSEAEFMPCATYMESQAHVNARMRGILVDWLVDVHKKYKLRPETLYLAVSLMDRFLERRSTPRKQLQLVGVTGLLVAGKFEELYPPQVQDLVFVTDKTYTADEVRLMEVEMLKELDFKVCQPTAVHFLDLFQRANATSCADAACDAETHRHLVHYLLELTLSDHRYLRFAPSHLAASAVLLSNKLLRREPHWPAEVSRASGMREQEVTGCAKEMCTLVEFADRSPLQAVRKKYAHARHCAVAKIDWASGPSAPQAALPAVATGGPGSSWAWSDVACDGPVPLQPQPLSARRRED